MKKIKICPCCGYKKFGLSSVLWADLIKQWGLSPQEVNYINRQQGLFCERCKSNLRSMTLAAAIMSGYRFSGTFEQFVNKYGQLTVLELNEAGCLNQYLKLMPGHLLADYPEVDMMKLPYSDNSYDLIVHSDTLEHVENPVKALKESLRVLRPGGFTCFTIPIVVGRLSAGRKKKSLSYHGTPGNDEHLVHTEYGADMWTQLMEAGFEECRLISLDYPASIAIMGAKESILYSSRKRSVSRLISLLSKVKK